MRCGVFFDVDGEVLDGYGRYCGTISHDAKIVMFKKAKFRMQDSRAWLKAIYNWGIKWLKNSH